MFQDNLRKEDDHRKGQDRDDGLRPLKQEGDKRSPQSVQKNGKYRRVLVAVKTIPGLFLEKKVKTRRKCRRDVKNHIRTKKEENIKEEVTKGTVKPVTVEEVITRPNPNVPKITLSVWTKEWMDEERYKKHFSHICGTASGKRKESMTKDQQMGRQMPSRKTGWPFMGRLCGGAPVPPPPPPSFLSKNPNVDKRDKQETIMEASPPLLRLKENKANETFQGSPDFLEKIR